MRKMRWATTAVVLAAAAATIASASSGASASESSSTTAITYVYSYSTKLVPVSGASRGLSTFPVGLNPGGLVTLSSYPANDGWTFQAPAIEQNPARLVYATGVCIAANRPNDYVTTAACDSSSPAQAWVEVATPTPGATQYQNLGASGQCLTAASVFNGADLTVSPCAAVSQQEFFTS